MVRRATAIVLLVAFSGSAFAAEPDSTPTSAPAPNRPGQTEERTITSMGAIWRSTLVPGWGQRYKGETRKGWWLTGAGAALATASIVSAKNASDAKSAYRRVDAGASSATFDRRYNDAVNATVVFNVVGALTAGFWAANVAESAFTPLEHLRVRDARVNDVFPSIHKFYETNPIASISLENRSGEAVSKVRVRFEAKDVMDLPAESAVIESIPAGLATSIPVTAAFNAKIFDVGRDEPHVVPAKITIEFEVGRKKREIVRTATFTIYNRNAIVWDDMRKMAGFVTPREEGLRAFAGAALQQEQSISTVKTIAQAAAYFDAMGAARILYVSDPRAPFKYFDGNAEAVDYIAFPRETLVRKVGDCDDLTALYASLLESSGIATAFVDVPGHVFLAFDSGLSPEEMRAYIGSDSAFLVRNGTAWIPVEVTAVGKSFNSAWSTGAAEVKKWSALKKMNVVDVASAQAEFPPSSPTFGTAAIASIDPVAFKALAMQDADRIGRAGTAARKKAEADILARKLPPALEANELGILLARDGNLREAEAKFEEAVRLDATLGRAWNNLANIAYLQGDTKKAFDRYETALRVGGDNAIVLINLALLRFEMGQPDLARVAFDRASRLEPLYKREFPELAALGNNAAGVGAIASTPGPSSTKAAAIGGLDPRRSRWMP